MGSVANESFPGAAVTALRAAGHDVVWVRTAAPGASDPNVLAWAVREERVLLTFDKDFGELARGSALPRLRGRPPARADAKAKAKAKAKAWSSRTAARGPDNGARRLGRLLLRHRAPPRSHATARIVVRLGVRERSHSLRMAAQRLSLGAL